MRLRLLTVALLLVAPMLLAAPATASHGPTCQQGQYDDGSSCVPCGPGTYQDETGQTTCKVAPAGTYVSTVGAAAATNCPADTTSPPGSTSVKHCLAAGGTDSDGDGVDDADDLCPDSVLSESTPQKNRYRADADGDFVNGRGQSSGITVADTGGCSAAQIIEAAGLGNGHVKHGLSIGALRDWVASLA